MAAPRVTTFGALSPQSFSETAGPPPAIRVQGLRRAFGRRELRRNLNFDVPAGRRADIELERLNDAPLMNSDSFDKTPKVKNAPQDAVTWVKAPALR